MYKYFLVIVFLLNGCSNITFNAAMCEQIASDPQAVMPEECRNYNEEEAQKAFDNTKHKQQSESEDVIKFDKK